MKLLGIFLVFAVGVSTAEKIVCYFSSWAVYRPGEGSYDVENINPYLCTHLIFSFSGLSNQTWEIEVLDPWNELCPPEPGGNNCAYKRFVELKKFNPDLTLLLAIGGWNEGSEDYSKMAADPQKRSTFVRSTVSLLLTQGFEGIDFDWEYPTQRGGAAEDKDNFITLLQELRTAFNAFSPPLLLTGALAAGKDTIDAAYDIQRLEPLLDQLHVMAYDYHGCFENFTHHNAPLCGYYEDTGEQTYYNINFTVSYYLELGVPKEKLVMGTPLYGRCYKLDNIDQNGMLSPAQQCGTPGPYVRIPGTLAANEICLRLKDDTSCTVVHDPNLHEPYFYCTSDNIWCGYDDADSLYLKARYAKNMGLAGVVIWTMDEDDFQGRCYEESSHLIKVIKDALEQPAGGDVLKCDAFPISTAQTTSGTTPKPSTTTKVTTPETTTPETTTPETTTTTTTTTTLEPTTPEPTTTTTTPDPTTTTTTTTTETTTAPLTTAALTTTPLPPTTTLPVKTTTPLPPTTTLPVITTTPLPQTTTLPVITTTPGGGRPDCTSQEEGTVFPHIDCDKYWECQYYGPTLRPCPPGTLFDRDLLMCNNEEEVEISKCRHWTCQVDDTKYPALDCNQYYRCYGGAPHLETCSEPLYWNQPVLVCDYPSHVDTSLCNPV